MDSTSGFWDSPSKSSGKAPVRDVEEEDLIAEAVFLNAREILIFLLKVQYLILVFGVMLSIIF